MVNKLKVLHSFTTGDWIQLFAIFVSVIAIFISNYLGNRASLRQYKRQQVLERYNYFYVPFIKWFVHEEPDKHLLNNLIINNSFDDFSDLIQSNIRYLGKKSIRQYYALISYNDFCVDKFTSQAESAPKSDLTAEKLNALFNDLVLSVLRESVHLAKELKLEPIGQPILDKYKFQLRHPK